MSDDGSHQEELLLQERIETDPEFKKAFNEVFGNDRNTRKAGSDSNKVGSSEKSEK